MDGRTSRLERLSPEDQVIRDLELMADREIGLGGGEGVADDTSTDCDDVSRDGQLGRTPEHGYSCRSTTTTSPHSPSTHDSLDSVQVDEGKNTEESAPEPMEVDPPHPPELPDTSQPELSDGASPIIPTPDSSSTPDPVKRPQTSSGVSKPSKPTVRSAKTAKAKTPPPKKVKRNAKVGRARRSKSVEASFAIRTAAAAARTPMAATPEVDSTTNPADFLQVEVKQENFDQYLDEENQKEAESVAKVGIIVRVM